MKSALLYSVLFCIGSLLLIGWRVHALQTLSTSHFEIVGDVSLSHLGVCESMQGLAEQVLYTQHLSPGSTLTVLVNGDRATANEPSELGSYAVPIKRIVLEGRSVSTRRQQEVLLDLRSKCRSTRRTTISPIFIATKQALADLRAQGCREAAHCKLFVDSDLEENVEPSIENRLRSAKAVATLATTLDNNGIDVTFCGLAVTTGRIFNSSGKETPRDGSHDDRLREVWLSAFAESQRVTFEPFCPKSSEVENH
jgi:hypothetical protein